MPVKCINGSTPLVLTFPYVGQDIPLQIARRMTQSGREQYDCDMHLASFLAEPASNATCVFATFDRALSDVNTLPGAKGAAGDDRPGMVAKSDGRGARIWADPPRPIELRNWQSAFFVPYHAAVAAHVAQTRAAHGFAIVCDCVIQRKSRQHAHNPHYDFSVASLMGATCDADLASGLTASLAKHKGIAAGFGQPAEPGWTVRSCGKPGKGVHAIQLRVSASAFMSMRASRWHPDEVKQAQVGAAVSDGLAFLKNWQPSRRFSVSLEH